MSSETNILHMSPLWSRNTLIQILNAALDVEQYRFANQLCIIWLAAFPGDLTVRLLQAKALAAEGLNIQAVRVLENLIQVDPEFLEAQSLLSRLYKEVKGRKNSIALGCAYALGAPGIMEDRIAKHLPNWSYTLAKVRKTLDGGNSGQQFDQIESLISETSNLSLTAVTHLMLLRANQDIQQSTLFDLAHHYHERWPECLQFSIILAETLVARGEPEKAVALLHRVASQDVTGQVINRIMGEHHAYKDLWPKKMAVIINIQIPFQIMAHLGWNLVPAEASGNPDEPVLSETTGKSQPASSNSEDISSDLVETLPLDSNVSSQDETIDSSPAPDCDYHQEDNIESNTREDQHSKRGKNAQGLFPVYVIFTTKQGLLNQFGAATTLEIGKHIRELVSAIRKNLEWGAITIYADDPKSMAEFGLKPVQTTDPWQLKLALADLVEVLGKRGARIGALLIVGGPEIVPFHHLPNPTDDMDPFVPSDNPYATRDENYFVPEWPVGRLPGGQGSDPGLMISYLRAITSSHENQKTSGEGKILDLLNWLIMLFFPNRKSQDNSFGFTAEAWRKASGMVFRPIGDPRTLLTSPPVEFSQNKVQPSSDLGYFNLHGVADSPEWFGQKDPKVVGSDPEYPVALHPKSITNGSKIPRIIFTEACYGAHITQKSVDEALALKFLASGTQALVGSTVISYGSVTTPLNAADLLCRGFWDHLKAGLDVGESLHRAKIALASEMHRRQGYLDGEDQKTLISFVLYGDPLAKENPKKLSKSRKLVDSCPLPPDDMITICDRVDDPGTSEPIPKEYLQNVKDVVAQYLPGMSNAKLSLSHNHAYCNSNGHCCPTSQLGKKDKHVSIPHRHVITLSKQIAHSHKLHESYARLTIDEDGTIIKLAVSR